MPRHRVHRKISKLLLGKPFTAVHRALDLPYILYKRTHRRYLHDPVTSAVVGAAFSDDPKKGVLAAWLHIISDRAVSEEQAVRLALDAGMSTEQVLRELSRLRKRLKQRRKSKRSGRTRQRK